LADGLLTLGQFSVALSALGLNAGAEELQAIHDELATLDGSRAPTLSPAGEARVRWLELLVVLERLGPLKEPSTSADLPSFGPIRGACLRKGVTCEDLRRDLREACSSAHQESRRTHMFCEVLKKLGLGDGELGSWEKACNARGPDALLLAIPFNEVALSAASLANWRSRCAHAAKQKRVELLAAFSVWPENVAPTIADFETVCKTALGAELSEDDIRDLALEAMQAGTKVDGKILLARGS